MFICSCYKGTYALYHTPHLSLSCNSLLDLKGGFFETIDEKTLLAIDELTSSNGAIYWSGVVFWTEGLSTLSWLKCQTWGAKIINILSEGVYLLLFFNLIKSVRSFVILENLIADFICR